MAEYLEVGLNLKSIVDLVNSTDFKANGFKERDEKRRKLSLLRRRLMHAELDLTQNERCAQPVIVAFHPSILQGMNRSSSYHVRPGVCVVGPNSRAVVRTKYSVASLLVTPLAIESFHVKKPDDVKDGALLVPKVILVASHCPGRKVLDDEGDEGQLDAIYDEVCDVGADLLVLYIDLPRILYPPVKHSLYHDKIAQLLFPSQPLLRTLALQHSFLTISENSDFNTVQRNLIRDWLDRPIHEDHPVYQSANQLLERSAREMEYWSDTEKFSNRYQQSTSGRSRSRSSAPSPTAWAESEGFMSATEEHPLIATGRSSRPPRSRHYGTLGRRSYVFGGRSYGTAPRNSYNDDDEVLLVPLREGDTEDGQELNNADFGSFGQGTRTVRL